MSDDKLSKLFSALDMFVLERTGDNCFKTLDQVPNFVDQVFPQATAQSQEWDFCSSAFLEHFMEDADKHWQKHGARQLWSDPWTETAPDNTEHSFQAVAVTVEGVKYLVVGKITGVEHDRRKLLQHARENLLLQRYLEEEVSRRTLSLREREEEIVFRLIGAADYRDEETGTHIRRMGLSSALLVRKLGWVSMRVEKMKLAACMHDVGKIGIPDGILLKAGRLTAKEFDIMKTHTLIGGKILQDSKAELLCMARDIALYHHENWDGSGYPYGVSGEDIPVSARCVSVCDVFDALAHKRVYRDALPLEKVLEIMRGLRGVKFDPAIFDLFMELLPKILEIKEEFKDEEERNPYVPLWEM